MGWRLVKDFSFHSRNFHVAMIGVGKFSKQLFHKRKESERRAEATTETETECYFAALYLVDPVLLRLAVADGEVS